MRRSKNVGGLDRIVRGVLGIWLIVVGIAAYIDEQRTKAAVATIAGLGLLHNVRTGFCGGNYLFGVDTTADEAV
ncbi:YgaP family membrane protein [Salinilacihabitans rarus]|uniref:YgaP family membrane protein n=1 Tax=Salinilacihabitans rarus TaxID=2961596 RepID=UPI0020C8E534|nr:DUF2892 domain-containing protein [Salinilacihabitans rarus]